LDPIAGLGKLKNICVWFPSTMLEENGGHGGAGAGGVKKFSENSVCDR